MISCAPIKRMHWVRFAASLLVAIVATMLLVPDEARANNVVCLVNSASLNLGTSTIGAGSIDFTCTSWAQGNRSFDLCIRLGNPSWPGTPQQPVLRGPNDARLSFNVFRDPAASTIWTQAQPLVQRVAIPGGRGNSFSGSFRVYAAAAPAQTPRPGTYQAFFYNTVIGFMNDSGQCNTTGNPQLSGQDFTLPVNRVVSNACTVSALGDADLGVVSASGGSASGSTTIAVQCPVGTAFNIGLRPSNGDSNGAGAMEGARGSNATASLPYQLRRESATGPVWGNTASPSGPGNGVGSTGTGADQLFPVFVTVPNTNAAPGTYRDTVIVTVHF